jgi:hypothetical protein
MLQQHKDAAMFCEEGLISTKAKNALLVPQNTKWATPAKTQNNTKKTNKHCTNCGMTNHNVETCPKKRKKTTVATTKVAQPSQKT